LILSCFDQRGLQGRRVALPAESHYRGILRRTIDLGINFEMIFIEPGQSLEETLLRVESGKYDLTIIDDDQLKAGFIGYRNLKTHFSLSEPIPHSWKVRHSDTQLLAALNKLINKEYRKAFYSVLTAKYIENPIRRNSSALLLSEVEKLSPYNNIVHKYAEQYSFDWRLIVAQMYQKSQFNQDATSHAVAEGLTQPLPDTTALMGIKGTADPDSNIREGTRYPAYLRDRFEQDLLREDRLWFSLTAYNAAYNRVKLARQVAEKMNLDKDRWFDSVEKAMLALSRPYNRKNEKLIRYCRCDQTAIYVREIKTLNSKYVRLSEVMKLAYRDPVPEKGS